jgi:hypothetical protein
VTYINQVIPLGHPPCRIICEREARAHPLTLEKLASNSFHLSLYFAPPTSSSFNSPSLRLDNSFIVVENASTPSKEVADNFSSVIPFFPSLEYQSHLSCLAGGGKRNEIVTEHRATVALFCSLFPFFCRSSYM